jgi:hypothetical protein
MSIYVLMDDKALAFAIADLEAKLEQMEFARGPVASKFREAFESALAAAKAELERRRRARCEAVGVPNDRARQNGFGST